MAPSPLRIVAEDGRTIEIVPNHIKPLRSTDMHLLSDNDDTCIQMEFIAQDPVIDGMLKSGKAALKFGVTFNQPPKVYSLVSGGWLPLPIVVTPRFLVDRNVVILLRKIREGTSDPQAHLVHWWTRLLDRPSGIFSPLPFAYESAYRRKPSMAEFIEEYDKGVFELLGAFPGCRVVERREIDINAAYDLLEKFDKRNENETKFLLDICPRITDRVSRQCQDKMASDAVRTAEHFQVDRGSLAVVAALSCVYEDESGKPTSIGRGILKPRQGYSESDAFNALNDLRHIQLATAFQALFHPPFHLCTCDKSLTLMWSALSPRGRFSTEGTFEITFDLNSDLFSRLDDKGMSQLATTLSIPPVTP